MNMINALHKHTSYGFVTDIDRSELSLQDLTTRIK